MHCESFAVDRESARGEETCRTLRRLQSAKNILTLCTKSASRLIGQFNTYPALLIPQVNREGTPVLRRCQEGQEKKEGAANADVTLWSHQTISQSRHQLARCLTLNNSTLLKAHCESTDLMALLTHSPWKILIYLALMELSSESTHASYRGAHSFKILESPLMICLACVAPTGSHRAAESADPFLVNACLTY